MGVREGLAVLYTLAVDWHRDIAPYELARAFAGDASSVDDEGADLTPAGIPASAPVVASGAARLAEVSRFAERLGSRVVVADGG